MKYIEWNIDPVALRVGGFPIMYYSLLLIAGTVLSVWILKRVYKENGMPWEHLQVLVMLSITGLFLGARLGHCLLYEYEYYFAHPLEILLPIRVKTDGTVVFSGYQGMASHGGLVGWMIAMVVYSRLTGEKVLRTLDTIALVLPLAAGFIRLGNLANSEIIGVETDLPWAFIFERVDLVPRHPAQIYEALAYFFTFGVNLLLYRRLGLNRGRGVLLGNTLVLVFAARFLIEFVKERQVPFEDQMHLDVGQVLSIPFILLGVFLLVRGLTGWKNRGQ
ncbi:prolipoprotein diacylglyceryl transferase [Butyricimonas faecalis]|uniref:Phosphatidylglycerol--prolipoprotein diacylglyceryl transferase n=1 Tax=Butyricimonas faecalis TaxID=2093856 RepID=A0A3Q9IWL2_9BACT|nr:prolipoprotein diacylglyceryl transferase [Butyricimonas faecalis]AZS31630.1 prolipoprotein diacylglyceryl transferase [Butyricimonas faecalis]